MLRKFLIISILISSCLFADGQYSIDSAIKFANVQYQRGNYNLALKEYSRSAYFKELEDPAIFYQIANCHYRLGNWAKARNYYDQVSRISECDTLLTNAQLKKISSLISEEKYNLALIDLINIADSLYAKRYIQIEVLYAVCYFGLEDFKESQKHFKRALKGYPLQQARVDSIFSDKKSFKQPNPKIAQTLSYILPGLGQLYSGNTQEALNSFILTETIFVIAVIVAINYSTWDAFMSVLPWYQRYYLGGIDNAKEIAEEKRKQRRSEAFKSTLNIINEINP